MPWLVIEHVVRLDPELMTLLRVSSAGIGSINRKVDAMAGELAELVTEVSESTTVMQSAIVLIEGFSARLQEAIDNGNPETLRALKADLDATGNALAAAVAANTPAAPPPSE